MTLNNNLWRGYYYGALVKELEGKVVVAFAVAWASVAAALVLATGLDLDKLTALGQAMNFQSRHNNQLHAAFLELVEKIIQRSCFLYAVGEDNIHQLWVGSDFFFKAKFIKNNL